MHTPQWGKEAEGPPWTPACLQETWSAHMPQSQDKDLSSPASRTSIPSGGGKISKGRQGDKQQKAAFSLWKTETPSPHCPQVCDETRGGSLGVHRVAQGASVTQWSGLGTPFKPNSQSLGRILASLGHGRALARGRVDHHQGPGPQEAEVHRKAPHVGGSGWSPGLRAPEPSLGLHQRPV